jgi:hypothetical protein
VWKVWTTPADWPGDAIQSARIDGDFAIGAKITIKVKGLPAQKLTVDRIEPQRLWASVGKLPGLTMTYEHTVEPAETATLVKERALLSGPLARVAGLLLGTHLRATFNANTAHCARVAEAREQG